MWLKRPLTIRSSRTRFAPDLPPQSAYLVCMSHSIAESGTLTTLPPHGTA